MNILFISDNYPPENNAASIRTYEHIQRWSLDNNITIITCFPNFPNGKIFKGYTNKIFDIQKKNKVRLIRVWSFIAANKGFLLRAIDFFSFCITSIIASFFVKRPDILIATSPQFFTAISVYIISIIKRVPYILEIRDLWPDSLVSVGVLKKTSFIYKILNKIEYFLYRRAKKLIVVTKSTADLLEEKGIERKKIEIIYNGVNLKKFQFCDKNQPLIEKYNLKDFFCIGYIGTIGLAHQIETIVEAAKYLERFDKNIKFILIGDGARRNYIRDLIKKKNLNNIILLKSVPNEDIYRYWSILDCSLTHLKKDNLFKTVIPSKIFESMAMGIPIIHGVSGESASLIKKLNIGELFESGNKTDLGKKILKLKSNRNLLNIYKKNCIKEIKHFDRNLLADKLLKHLTK